VFLLDVSFGCEYVCAVCLSESKFEMCFCDFVYMWCWCGVCLFCVYCVCVCV